MPPTRSKLRRATPSFDWFGMSAFSAMVQRAPKDNRKMIQTFSAATVD
jgi:hypothetical protein